MDHYILNPDRSVSVVTFEQWAKAIQLEKTDVRRVHSTVLPVNDVVDDETIYISTVFLGIAHQYGDGEPLIFETMVFGGDLDQEQDRCSTWNQAVDMHLKMVGRVVLKLQGEEPQYAD